MYECSCIADDEQPGCCKHVHVIHSLYNSLAIATGDIPNSYLEENADEAEMDTQPQVISFS